MAGMGAIGQIGQGVAALGQAAIGVGSYFRNQQYIKEMDKFKAGGQAYEDYKKALERDQYAATQLYYHGYGAKFNPETGQWEGGKYGADWQEAQAQGTRDDRIASARGYAAQTGAAADEGFRRAQSGWAAEGENRSIAESEAASQNQARLRSTLKQTGVGGDRAALLMEQSRAAGTESSRRGVGEVAAGYAARVGGYAMEAARIKGQANVVASQLADAGYAEYGQMMRSITPYYAPEASVMGPLFAAEFATISTQAGQQIAGASAAAGMLGSAGQQFGNMAQQYRGGGGGGGSDAAEYAGMGVNAAATLGGAAIIKSDPALKKDIKPIRRALEKVKRLKPSTWKWNSDAEAMGLRGDEGGIMATEVPAEAQRVLPSGHLGYSLPHVVGVLTGAVQELSHEVEAMRHA